MKKAKAMVDLRDASELSRVLTGIYLFVDHLNSLYVQEVQRRLNNRESKIGSVLIDGNAKSHLLHSALQAFRQLEYSPPKNSQIGQVAKDLDLLSRPLGPFLESALTKIEERVKTTSRGKGRFLTIKRTDELKLKLWLHEGKNGYDFSNFEIPGQPGMSGPKIYGQFCDEPLDPLQVIRNFLVETCESQGVETNEGRIDFYIQRWIRLQFGISYKEWKYPLKIACEYINSLFYGSYRPSSHRIHTYRSGLIGLGCLLNKITANFSEPLADEVNKNKHQAALWTLGYFVFLRHCRTIRCRYFLRINRFFTKVEGEDIKQSLPLLLRGGKCVSALRPAEYTYSKSRLAGAMSGIPGYNYVFKGGFLPRTESGQTLVIEGPPGSGKTALGLQMMADIACRGQLAVYFSFEESYDAIFERLAAFGLLDNSRFLVCPVFGDEMTFAERIHSTLDGNPRRGLLFLYGHRRHTADSGVSSQVGLSTEKLKEFIAGERSEYSLTNAIESIAADMGDRWPWRALVIDSFNALRFRGGATRVGVRSLIKSIEENKFFGVILSEEGDESHSQLSYLADTVIQNDFDTSRKARTLTVTKCRRQDCHRGPHIFRIVDSKGVVIYPAMSAICDSLRRRIKTTLSEKRRAEISPFLRSEPKNFTGPLEKSMTLIYGHPDVGKSRLLINLLTAPSVYLSTNLSRSTGNSTKKVQPQEPRPPKRVFPENVLIVSFEQSERRFMQYLRRPESSGLKKRWDSVSERNIRWYAPGDDFTPEQIFSELWAFVDQAKRQGHQIDRIAFLGVEVAEQVLPNLGRESLFWITLTEWVSAEAITSFFVENETGNDAIQRGLHELLKARADYVLRVERETQEDAPESPLLWVEKSPELSHT